MSEFAYFVEHRLNKSLQYALNPYCGIIVAMKDIHPYITNDGSVGLYSPEFDDIYHSTFGAYAEACEKFIIPAMVCIMLALTALRSRLEKGGEAA